jgi:hypothetical protein
MPHPPSVIALTPRRLTLVAVSLGLLAASLALVVAGNFISWNDVHGTQPESWHYRLGDLAALAAAVGAVVSLFDRTARHLAGAVVASFVGFLVVANAVAPDFCFVGSEDSFGLTMWEVLLGFAAFVLLTPRWTRIRKPWERRPGRRDLTAWSRWVIYCFALVPLAMVVMSVSSVIATMGHPECGGPGDACAEDYVGWFFGLAALAAIIIGVVVTEIVTAGLRWRRRRSALS